MFYIVKQRRCYGYNTSHDPKTFNAAIKYHSDAVHNVLSGKRTFHLKLVLQIGQALRNDIHLRPLLITINLLAASVAPHHPIISGLQPAPARKSCTSSRCHGNARDVCRSTTHTKKSDEIKTLQLKIIQGINRITLTRFTPIIRCAPNESHRSPTNTLFHLRLL